MARNIGIDIDILEDFIYICICAPVYNFFKGIGEQKVLVGVRN